MHSNVTFSDLTLQSVFNALSLQRYAFFNRNMIILMNFSVLPLAILAPRIY